MHDSGSRPRQIEWALLFSAGQAWAGQGARREHTRAIDSESRFWLPPARAPVLGTRPKGPCAPLQTLMPTPAHQAAQSARPGAERSGVTRFVPELAQGRRPCWVNRFGPFSQHGRIWTQPPSCSGEELASPQSLLNQSVPHGVCRLRRFSKCMLF